MRRRVAVWSLSALAVLSLISFAGPLAHASAPATHGSFTFAQDEDTTTTEDEGVIGEEDESQGTEDTEGSESGQSDEEAETGAKKGKTAEGEAPEEEGPPWTYQMARIGIVLMLLVFGAIAMLYYKMVVLRQRGEA